MDNTTSQTDYFLSQLSTPILVLDDEFKVIYANHACEQLTKMSQKQLCKYHLDQILTSPSLTEFICSPNLTPLPCSINHNHLVQIDDPTEIKMTIGYFNKANLVEGYIVEIQTNDYHQYLLQQQDSKHHHLGHLLFKNLAHEMKNPLGGIQGAVHLILSETQDKEIIDCSKLILEQVERLTNLADKALYPFSQSKFSLTNLHSLIEKSRKIILLEGSNTELFMTDYDPSLPEIYLDEAQLTQVLLNIFHNALEAKANQIHLKTRIAYRKIIGQQQYPMMAQLDIADNGCGIPEKLIDTIFFPTISGKNSTGLGLSIAQQIIQAHKGMITCHNLAQGCQFQIFLPIQT